MNFSNYENDENLAFLQTFQFYLILDYFKNPNSKSLDLHCAKQTSPLTKIKVEGNCNLKYVDSETRCLVRQRDCLKKKANHTGSKYLSQAFQQV